MKKRTKLQDGIFLAAGIYLIYIAYQLFKETPEATGPRIALTIAEIVFVIVGVWITIRSVLAFIPRNQEESTAGSEKDADAESEEHKTEEVADIVAGEIEDQTASPDDIKSEESEEESQESKEGPENLGENSDGEDKNNPEEL